MKKCKFCKKVIHLSDSKNEYSYKMKKFCSNDCSSKYWKLKYQLKNKSRKDYYDWRGIKIKCAVCKKLFTRNTSTQIYCSKECAKFIDKNENNRFVKLRFEILKRDNFTCQYCGRNVKEDKVKLHIDHIIPKKMYGNNNSNNLITSCEDCNLGKGDVLLTQHQLKPLSEATESSRKSLKLKCDKCITIKLKASRKANK